MRNFKIIILLSLTLFASCGKSPLFNKVEKAAGSIVAISNSFSLKWTTPPSLSELGVFELTLSSPLKTTQTINAYIWMPDMGHGSSPIEIKQVSELQYIFSEVAFIMPGLWVLHIEILENNQVVDQWQKSIVL